MQKAHQLVHNKALANIISIRSFQVAISSDRRDSRCDRALEKESMVSDVINKLWGFCHTLRHDGIDYGDYIEQLTYLLFLKMADERGVDVPLGCEWESLKK